MDIKRNFLPGEQWIYLKIYTGIKTADIILEETIAPLMKLFIEELIINQWFFIRYQDKAPHLRLRLYIIHTKNYFTVLNRLKTALEIYIHSGEISGIVQDTYSREIERYGKNTMNDAEALFYYNSEFTLQCLQYHDEEKIMAILFYIDQLLSQIGLSVNQRLQWIKDYNEYFKEEFNTNKHLNRQLDKKYRAFYPKFLDFSQSSQYCKIRNTIMKNLYLSNDALQNICNSYNEHDNPRSLQFFFQSIFHMTINRFFVSEQRLFEMIVYDYLHRYYKTLFFHFII
ncbi:lantibiotic dehydratase [Elizabethkingia anophelis]|nr:lantibiotic dehydratase [Elizabethkingia anophelis]